MNNKKHERLRDVPAGIDAERVWTVDDRTIIPVGMFFR